MWIYDGDEWIEEGASEDSKKTDTTTPRFDEYYPELQVIEIVPTPRPNIVPLPIP